MARAGELADLCDALWPPAWAEPWDNVGLLLGSRGAEVSRCMWALDADVPSIEAAAAAGCQLLCSHHPLPFRPLTRVRTDDPSGAAVLLAARSGLCLYAAHTNLDVHPRGTSWALAQALGLHEARLLRPAAAETLLKLVVFVPAAHAEAVLQALGDAGAGRLGQYSHCSFSAPGTGAFRPLPGARPFAGEVGVLHREAEVRLEVLLPEVHRAAAVAALLAAHPYEEVAYDLIRLENPGPARGYGMVGRLARPARLESFAAAVGRRLGAAAVRFVGSPERAVRRAAVCGGAGASCVDAALAEGADALVTADLRYHESREAEARGLALVDPGHQATEAPVVAVAASALREAAEAAGLQAEVLVQPRRADVWRAARRGRP